LRIIIIIVQVGAMKTYVIAVKAQKIRKIGCNAPPSSLMDLVASPKVKIMEGEGARVCSLACSTSGVEGRAKVPKCGLERLTNNLVTHIDLHKPNNKLVSA
jgi:hypothetical protein